MLKLSPRSPLPVLCALWLAGCASHKVSAPPAADGPATLTPPNLAAVPNALPRLEPIRKGGPNKPYEVLGQRYEPLTTDESFFERGLASWYGRKFHGRPTASGEIYNMFAMTGAHPTLPIPSYARVRNPANGREVIVRINDRGPFHAGRIVDLSYTAALKLDILRGVAPVELRRLTFEEIRSGAWQKDTEAPVFAATAPEGAPQPTRTSEVAEEASGGFWVQLGAFNRLEGAEAMRKKLVQRLDLMAPLLAIFKEKTLHRLQAGPYATRGQAQAAAEQVRSALDMTPVVVERR